MLSAMTCNAEGERLVIRYILATALLIPMGLSASTPESWTQLDQRSGRACLAMSSLARPELLAYKNSFSDVIGVDLRMIRGRDARGQMKRMLCAFNRRTGRVEVQDAGNWMGPAVRP